MGSQFNIGKQRGSCGDYNANNTWYFNGTNGTFNNNNRYNTNFRSRPVFDYGLYDNASLATYPVPLSEWLIIAEESTKGKSSKPCYVFFMLHRIEELVRLAHQVGNCEVLPTESTAHIITVPRVREIVCATAPKRVMQTFYIRSLQPYLERHLYHKDSYSCRRGKGSLKAVLQLQEYIFEQSNGYTEDLWLAKVDIKSFFMSLDCFMVCRTMEDFIRKEMAGHPHKELLLYLTRITYLAATQDHLRDMAHPAERAMLEPSKALRNHPYYQGVPIGDWTSQTAGLVVTTFALRYLESLGYAFVHYTDDTTILVRDKEKWLEDIDRLDRFYKGIGLTLHPDKRYLQHHSKGVEMVGYKVRFNRLLPSDRIAHNLKWYIERTIRRAERSTGWLLAHSGNIQSTINSYLGFLKWCNAYRLRQQVCNRVRGSVLGMVLEPAEGNHKVTIRSAYTKAEYYKREYKELKHMLAA